MGIGNTETYRGIMIMNPNLMPWKRKGQDEEDDFEPDKEGVRKVIIILQIVGLIIMFFCYCESCCSKLHII